GELRMLEDVAHMRRRLNLRDNLDKSLQAVVNDFLQFSGSKRSGSADDGIGWVFELIFEFEADHIDLEASGPVKIALQRLDAVLMMLGVPMQEPQLQLRPVFYGCHGQIKPAARPGFQQLQQGLRAIKQPLIRVAGDLD